MDDIRNDAPLARAATWLQATPAELVGLAVLLVGALAATALLWLQAAQRPSALPDEAATVGVDGAGGESVDDASPEGDVHPGPEAGTGHADAPATAADGHGHADELASAGPIVVHVTGAVTRAGVVQLAAGARVADAVAAAGGAAPDADVTRLNLARRLDDGEHVHLPREGEEPTVEDSAAEPGALGDPAAGAAGVGPGGRIDLNRATAETLQQLPGVGPAKADAVVRHREQHGPFEQPGDLRDVPGIGDKTFQSLADLVTVS